MPSLDVTDVLFDPDIADSFCVRRNSEVVGLNGRTEKVGVMHDGLTGVINVTDGDLTRRDDSQIVTETIEVYSHFSMRDASFGFQPDVILWRGSEYLVKVVTPARQYGTGFTKAVAVSFRATDRPPPAS